MKIRYILSLASAIIFLNVCSAADPHWIYEEQADWGALESEDAGLVPPANYPYAECSIGRKQSPVDLIRADITQVTENKLKFEYTTNPLSISNNGHTVKVNVANGNVKIGATAYSLLQFHMHAPSEHTINGHHYPLEIHFVHGTPDGKLAVVGVFAKIGGANWALQKVLDNTPDTLQDVAPEGITFNPVDLVPAHSLPATSSFFTYSGSLTTPPCTEGVQWYVLKTPIEISAEQLALYQEKYLAGANKAAADAGLPSVSEDGNRWVQPLNGRIVVK